MAKPKTAAKNEQRPFEIQELFFSTTDRAGVIRSGNEVFRRVADFETLEQMVGRPHNVIRHADMPRAVFRLLWDYLEADKTVCAYVKNQAQDGAFYWVVALVVPIAGGYLSVRFKPSSPIFQIVQELYGSMRSIEIQAGDKPKVRDEGMRLAGEHLAQALNELGFADYDTFMRTAIATEMGSRAQAMEMSGITRPEFDSSGVLGSTLQECYAFERTLDRMFLQVGGFLDLIGRLESKSSFLSNLAEEISLLALNSIISCQRHGEAGRGLAVVAEHLSAISRECATVITDMTVSIQALIGALRESAFYISAAKLQVEISVVFLGELITKSNGINIGRQHDDLHMLAKSFVRSVSDTDRTLPLLLDPIDSVTSELRELSRMMRALSRVHLIGQVEAAHLQGADTFLQLFNEVAMQLDAAKMEIRDFTEAIHDLRNGLPDLIASSESLLVQVGAFHLAAA